MSKSVLLTLHGGLRAVLRLRHHRRGARGGVLRDDGLRVERGAQLLLLLLRGGARLRWNGV